MTKAVGRNNYLMPLYMYQITIYFLDKQLLFLYNSPNLVQRLPSHIILKIVSYCFRNCLED